jgi:hypothetical protein
MCVLSPAQESEPPSKEPPLPPPPVRAAGVIEAVMMAASDDVSEGVYTISRSNFAPHKKRGLGVHHETACMRQAEPVKGPEPVTAPRRPKATKAPQVGAETSHKASAQKPGREDKSQLCHSKRVLQKK